MKTRMPVSWPVLLAVVVTMFVERWLYAAAAAWLALGCLLRPDEVATLQRRHLVLPSDGRALCSGVFALIGAKTANRGNMVQSELIYDQRLPALVGRTFGALRPGELLCSGGLPSFRQRVYLVVAHLRLNSRGLSLGSERLGGGTSAFE